MKLIDIFLSSFKVCLNSDILFHTVIVIAINLFNYWIFEYDTLDFRHLGMLYLSSVFIGILCVTCSAIYLEDTQSSRHKPLPQAVSKCKRKSFTAYDLCMDELAKSKAVKYECIRTYMRTFPTCYFKAGESSDLEILKSYSKCVMECINYSENFACSNAVKKVLARTKSQRSSAGDTMMDNYLRKRSNVQNCNKCRNEFDICTFTVITEFDHSACVLNRDDCFRYSGCR